MGAGGRLALLSSLAMPELPEVEVVRRSLRRALLGRRVVAVTAQRVRLRAGIEPQEWLAVVGQRLGSVERRGKFLLLHLDSVVAVLHLGMSGRLLVRPGDAPTAPHTHLVVGFDGGLTLHLVDPRRFGSATVVPAAALASVPILAALGPDALGSGVEEAIARAAASSRVPIRNLLLDQRVVAGVGNIYATEALARAGIHPARRAHRISSARLARLAAALRAVLEEAIAAGGTTLADGGFQDAAGNTGYFAVDLEVYGRAGLPCRRCGMPIQRLVLGGRSTFACRRCQR